jgi:hypothetical protein
MVFKKYCPDPEVTTDEQILTAVQAADAIVVRVDDLIEAQRDRSVQ